MNLQLRKALPDEIKLLQEFAREVINNNYRAFLGDEAVDYFIGSGASDQYISDNVDDTTVAVINRKIVGVCICKENLIDMIMVLTELHGQGIGSQMISLICDKLFTVYDELRLESFEANTKANAFYEKNGWTIAKIEYDAEIGGNRIYYIKHK